MNTPDTQNTDSTPRPFGYWLKAVDRLMAAEFDSAFDREGASRRDWRLLNIVDGTVAARRPLTAHKVHGLVERGWVVADGDTWTLTDEGRAAKERLGGIVDGIRAQVADAVSPDDFETTLATLEQIARSFGWDEETPLPRGRGRRRGFGRRGFGPRFGPGFGPGFGSRGFHRGLGHGPAFSDERGCGHRGHPGHDRFSGPQGERKGHDHDFAHEHAERPDHDRDYSHEHGHGHGHGHGHHAHPGRGDGHGHGHHAHHAHPGRGEHGVARAAQHAYERGFDAGFSRGRDA